MNNTRASREINGRDLIPTHITITTFLLYLPGSTEDHQKLRRPSCQVDLDSLHEVLAVLLVNLPNQGFTTAMDPQVAGGGPAPFLQKTYDMVDDSSSDVIVSWGSKRDTFVVWDPLEFARILLPSYFKHNNFSSFIRQLNTYGFRKVDAEKWVFRNEDFVRGERHRLKNIHRKKPTHSHSNPIVGVDSERAALEEEIERLSRERDTLREELRQSRLSEVESGVRFAEMESKLGGMEQRQERLINFLHRAVKNPTFVKQLLASVDASSVPKRRRSLSRGVMDGSSELADNSCSNDGHSSTSKPLEFGQLFPQDFSNKLKLELCPAVSNGDLDLCKHQRLRECGDRPQTVEVDGNPDVIECRLFLPEEELADTSMSMCQKRSSLLPWLPINEDEEPRDSSCQLNLTLASSTLHFNENIADRVSKSTDQNMEEEACLGSNNMRKEDHFERTTREQDSPGDKHIGTATSNQAISATNNKPSAPAGGRVNDLFWEQFLTERPGSSENEEASSCLKTSNQEDRMHGSETWINRNGMGAMKL